jgi:hypothetical protein
MASWVKELQRYMSSEPNGRKISITEFKELTEKDKKDFHDMLVAEGVDVDPIPAKQPEAA